MKKLEVLKSINSSIYEYERAMENLYHGKTFAATGYSRIDLYFKTKRGAEGYIKRQSGVSYYDEITFEMVNCGDGLEIIEIKESEIKDIKTNIDLWIKELESCFGWGCAWSREGIKRKANLYLSENKALCNAILEEIDNAFDNHNIDIKKLKAFKEELNTPVQEVETVEESSNDNNEYANKVELKENKELNGIELIFNGKVNQETSKELKSHGFRFSFKKKLWYAKNNTEIKEFINKFTNKFNNGVEVKEDIKALESTQNIEENKEEKKIEIKRLTTIIESDEILNKNQYKELLNKIELNATYEFTFFSHVTFKQITIVGTLKEINKKNNRYYFNYSIKNGSNLKKNKQIEFCNMFLGMRGKNYKLSKVNCSIETYINYFNSINAPEEIKTIKDTVNIDEPTAVTTIDNKCNNYKIYIETQLSKIENFIISEDIIKKENDNSLFRRGNLDHNQNLTNYYNALEQELIDDFSNIENIKYIDKAIGYYKTFKQNYFNITVKILNHKANNPSWAVTGRSGLNINRYNKMNDRYNNMLIESSRLVEEYKNKIANIKHDIKKEKRLKFINKLESYSDVKGFSKSKVNINIRSIQDIFNNSNSEVNCYIKNNLYIIKHWGSWKVYSNNGNLVKAPVNTFLSLKDAKKLVNYLIINQNLEVV